MRSPFVSCCDTYFLNHSEDKNHLECLETGFLGLSEDLLSQTSLGEASL